MSAPVFTPPQTQPLSSHPQNLRSIEYPQGAAESSAESEFPTLRYANDSYLFIYLARHHKLFIALAFPWHMPE